MGGDSTKAIETATFVAKVYKPAGPRRLIELIVGVMHYE
jgi:hypothetical protein